MVGGEIGDSERRRGREVVIRIYGKKNIHFQYKKYILRKFLSSTTNTRTDSITNFRRKINETNYWGAGELAQKLGPLDAFLESWVQFSVPRVVLMSPWTPAWGEPVSSSGLFRHLHSHGIHSHRHRNKYQILKNRLLASYVKQEIQRSFVIILPVVLNKTSFLQELSPIKLSI